MEDLMELLDDKIFTPELKEKISDALNQAIETEVEIRLATKAASEENGEGEEGEEIYDGEASVLNDMSKEDIVVKAEDYAVQEAKRLSKKHEEYVQYVTETAKKFYSEKAEKYKDYVLEKVESKIDSYLTSVTETFMNEAAPQIMQDEEVIAKANALVEGFQSMLTTGSVYLKDIVESSANEDKKSEIDELKSELDKLVVENTSLKKEKAASIRKSILDESIKGLSVPSQEAVLKIEKHLKFVSESSYKKQLDSIVSDVQMRGKGGKLESEKDSKKLTESSDDMKAIYSRLL